MVKKEYTEWIVDEIRHICETYKKRIAGAESTRAAMLEMAAQLRLWCDNVSVEEFNVHPNAFMGSVPLQGLLDICGVIAFLIALRLAIPIVAVISALFFLAAAALWLSQYVLYRQCFDFLFRKKNAINVMGERKASSETKQRIILCGHADAAYEMSFMLHMKSWHILTLIAGADIGMFVCLAFGLLYGTGAVSSHTASIFGIIEAVLLLAYIPWLFFLRWNVIADGANDNLTGCYIAMSILKEMEEQDIRLEHTDLCCLITDGEESGLRGALAYAETHQKELIDSNSIVIAMDTIHDPKEIMVYHRGVNFTQKNSIAVCELMREAGIKCGIDIPYAGFYPGATDAEAFSRYGVEAAAICAVQHDPSTYYHTRYDTWDNLNIDGIEKVREIITETIKLIDQNE